MDNKETTEVIHKRRVRYSGTHPRRFEEKYKELNPEKYTDDVAHIISRVSYILYGVLYKIYLSKNEKIKECMNSKKKHK